MSRARRVFVSSASGALLPYRRVAVDVCRELGLEPVFMEDFDPDRRPPLEVCRRLVDSSDVFLLLVAHRYGARPPGEEKSYTELEYERALSRTPPMPLLCYLIDPDHHWPPREIDRGSDARALDAFVERLRRSHVTRAFTTPEVLKADLVLRLGSKRTAPGPRRQIPRPPAFHAVPRYLGSIPFTGRAGDLRRLDEWARGGPPMMVVEATGGTGKSALTWEWAVNRAPAAIDGLRGRLWWSFYEGSAHIRRFLREVLAYVSGDPYEEVAALPLVDLTRAVVAALTEHPHLLVLDGFERLLHAYHRQDPSKLRDDRVDPGLRAVTEPHAEDFIRMLTTVAPSKVLLSTRLMPAALENNAHRLLPGVAHLRLPGLTDADTHTLLGRLGVRSSGAAAVRFFGRLDNHPLLIGIVAGLCRDYRPAPGDFDAWMDDPAAGAAFTLPNLQLTQRQSHILAAALRELADENRQVLAVVSALSGAVDWATLRALNPLQPPDPPFVEPDLSHLGPEPTMWIDPQARPRPLANAAWRDWDAARREARERARKSHDEAVVAWRKKEGDAAGRELLEKALTDLEERGLLWWDRATNSYDLHPLVRAYVYDQLADVDRISANMAIRDHFMALPPENLKAATSVEDLRRTIAIFRAFVGAGWGFEAGDYWLTRLRRPLVEDIGAYATVVELLTPIVEQAPQVRTNLAVACRLLGRVEDAYRHLSEVLRHTASTGHLAGLVTPLDNVATLLDLRGELAAADRTVEIVRQIDLVLGQEDRHIVGRASRALARGHAGLARELLTRAEGLGEVSDAPWMAGDLVHLRLLCALEADGNLTAEMLQEARPVMHRWVHRRKLAEIRLAFHLRGDRLPDALEAAREIDRLERNAGLEPGAQAATAVVLARMGRTPEAAEMLDAAVARAPVMDRALRPDLWIAEAMTALGRVDEATGHARRAYRWAWADGPQHCRYWPLRRATDLLERLGVPPPATPKARTGVRAPHEDRILRLIERKRRG